MTDFHVSIGDRVTFSKTVGESDVYLFAGITGDLGPNHVNETYMQKSAYGTRIAHGALLIGYMSTASTMVCEKAISKGIDETPVSLGYDRVRFLKASSSATPSRCITPSRPSTRNAAAHARRSR
jgi:acyl dehydratase